MKIDPKTLPTEFRGCAWDDGWEFDGPCVVYYPRRYMRFGIGGNNGTIDSIVEDICFDLGEGKTPHDGGLAKECGWRGYSMRGFARRKNAEHVVVRVKWVLDETGRPWAEVIERTWTMGPPERRAK